MIEPKDTGRWATRRTGRRSAALAWRRRVLVAAALVGTFMSGCHGRPCMPVSEPEVRCFDWPLPTGYGGSTGGGSTGGGSTGEAGACPTAGSDDAVNDLMAGGGDFVVLGVAEASSGQCCYEVREQFYFDCQ